MKNLLIFSVAATLLIVNSQITNAADLEDGLVLYFPFDEGDGATATDTSVNGFVGKLNGECVWVEDGKSGGAIEFTRGNVIVPDDDLLDVEQLTVMAWIFPTAISDATSCHNWGNVIYHKSGSSDDSVEFALMKNDGACLYINSGHGGNKRMGPFDGADVDNSLGPVNLGLKTDVWYHIAATFDGENLKVYLDGELGGEKAIAAGNPSIIWNDNDSYIGGRDYQESWFVGMIDEFALFNRALDEDEINQMIRAVIAVAPISKLTTTWSTIKTR